MTTRVIPINTQNKLQSYLLPRLEKRLNKELDKREKEAKGKVAEFKNHEDVAKLRRERSAWLDLFQENMEKYKNGSEEVKKVIEDLYQWKDLSIKDYFKDNEAFIVNFHTNTDDLADKIALRLAKDSVGIRDSWDMHYEMRTELEARLSTQLTAGFADIVAKIEKDMDVNKYFN